VEFYPSLAAGDAGGVCPVKDAWKFRRVQNVGDLCPVAHDHDGGTVSLSGGFAIARNLSNRCL